MICTDSPEVSLLDTAASGDSLDQARDLTLATADDGVSGAVTGVRISPDGTRLIASLMPLESLITDEKGHLKPMKGSGLVAYGTADGKPIDVLHREIGNGAVELLDLDGTGQNMIVRIEGEVGAVGDAGYRTLFKQDLAPTVGGSKIVW
jgi:hypothetical protein